MARRLNTYVHVHVDGETRVYGPGDKVPGAVAKLITAPDVWEEGEADEPLGSSAPAAPVTPTAPSAPAAAAPAPAPATEPGIPPKKGKGSGVEAWRAYADAKGFDIDADVKREDIIHALTEAGIPTE